ncbi:type II toxin-antitoxin system Phd/YefM family antitoxin [Enterococcus casseliflavus]|uniref:type II toxin-antitoxin system Phd/YefM family antitoxin n=1 Tax=Enterococcus sp. 8E11_MSG4843 TaxID=1834190 RepID=UPI000B672F64|nr:type II toxin-antitoxin system Phd/YefM family antitoxin [Enterococcus sp. 8E11_MSG4843]MBO1095512.1 type II toxin-antitoxin system Phd/YefM family antitoxin [Enterococcus casseliflavus]MBO1144187.1 type II toxin-antitoxin system Phd/YefM family antitoxin [Enterococcus casseliflavus]OUZ34517.1 hypothetical protein A5885_002248 [Enterococcus sp. 8E11_MSG4843]
MTAIIQRSTGLDTISSTDVSRKYAKVSEIVKSAARPLEVTKNGKTDMVVMNPELFISLIDMIEDYQDKISALEYESNRNSMEFVPADEVLKDISLGEYEGMSLKDLASQ